MANLKDYATGTVASPPVPADSGTTFTVQTGEGSRYPAVPFSASAHPVDEMPTLNNAEKILVTNITSDTLTVTRAQGDTTAKNIAAGWRISNALFVGDFINSSDLIDEDSMATNSASKVPSQQSVKAYADSIVAAAKQALFPVGSIYTNASDSTNPGTLLGFGTWTAFGKSRVMIGHGQDVRTFTFANTDVVTGTDTITVPSNDSLITGQAVVLSGTGSLPTGLSATTYYVVRQSATTIKLATTLANAVAGTVVDITAQGTGTNTLTQTLTSRTAGDIGGEETHASTTSEIPTHRHSIRGDARADSVGVLYGANGSASTSNMTPASSGANTATYTGTLYAWDTGSSGAHNNVQPYIVVYMWQRTA